MRTYTWGAGRQLRHISMLTGEEHGFRVNNGVHEDSNTLLRIVHDETNSKLKAKLLRDGRDVTDECAASAFVWTKAGSAAGTGKEIAVTDAEVNGDVQFSCTYTETQGVYGTVSVDNNLVASHDPATADANHVFTLENGMLKVEIPNNAGNGTDYELVDGVLSVNPGFTGTLTAEYAFTTAPTREIDFEYDHNGLRTQKKVVENGITTIYDYTLHGKLITHLTKSVVDLDNVEASDSEELHFFYDAQSKPAFVEYGDVKYRYIHNLQGDIVAIVDSSGAPVVEYKYDAWGKKLSVAGSMATTLGALNPFRYRGYVYDDETELYYLRSRYYTSCKGRWLNADGVITDVYSIYSINIFAYCKNYVINYSDADGKSLKLAIYQLLLKARSMIRQKVKQKIDKKKVIDITDRLNKAMEDHYNELKNAFGLWWIPNMIFAVKSKTGGEWDLKYTWGLDRNTTYVYAGQEITYDDVGNIHYGYVGSAIGNPLNLLLDTAGVYQRISGTSSPEYDPAARGDDPADQQAIIFGYMLRNNPSFDPSTTKIRGIDYADNYDGW